MYGDAGLEAVGHRKALRGRARQLAAVRVRDIRLVGVGRQQLLGDVVPDRFEAFRAAERRCCHFVPGEPHQAKAIYFYFLPPGTPPTFVVDITDQFDDWIAALDCHRSQFHNPDKPRPPQLPSVRENFESFARYWGWQIGTKYAQAFLATSPLKVGDPLSLVTDVVPRP